VRCVVCAVLLYLRRSLPYALKMESAYSSEMSVNIYRTTRKYSFDKLYLRSILFYFIWGGGLHFAHVLCRVETSFTIKPLFRFVTPSSLKLNSLSGMKIMWLFHSGLNRSEIRKGSRKGGSRVNPRALNHETLFCTDLHFAYSKTHI
jgi:hypothetical protein